MEIRDTSIPDLEKQNVISLCQALKKAALELNQRIETRVVGGVLNKKWPRKDIDIVCEIIGARDELTGTELEKANQELDRILEITKKAISYNDYYSILEVKRPYIEAQFNNPNILDFGGTIRMKPKMGTEIEIIKP